LTRRRIAFVVTAGHRLVERQAPWPVSGAGAAGHRVGLAGQLSPARIELRVQGLADDVRGEASPEQASGHDLAVGTAASGSQPAGSLDLRAVIDDPKRIAGESAVDALGGQLGGHDGEAAGARPVRHQRMRERGIVQVAQPSRTGHRVLDCLRRTPFAAQLPAKLKLAVRPETEQPDGEVEGVRRRPIPRRGHWPRR